MFSFPTSLFGYLVFLTQSHIIFSTILDRPTFEVCSTSPLARWLASLQLYMLGTNATSIAFDCVSGDMVMGEIPQKCIGQRNKTSGPPGFSFSPIVKLLHQRKEGLHFQTAPGDPRHSNAGLEG